MSDHLGMSFSDLVSTANDAQDEKADALVAWCRTLEERVALLEPAKDEDTLPAKGKVVPDTYSKKLGALAKMRVNDPDAFYAKFHPPPADDVKLGLFLRSRVVCWSFTAVYAVCWIVFLITLGMILNTPDGTVPDETLVTVNNWFGIIEFMWTGLAETATLAELLMTLPSRDGGPAAIWHFRIYEVVFGVCTATLYGMTGEYTHVGIYLAIHTIKLLLVGWIFGVAREHLYHRFASDRHAAAGAFYLVARREGGVPDVGRLLAATTLSVALPQSYVLTVCVRDASNLDPQRLATFTLHWGEVLSFFAIGLFALVGLAAYFLALQVGGAASTLLTTELGRTIYYGAQGVYFGAVALVGREVNIAARRRRAASVGAV